LATKVDVGDYFHQLLHPRPTVLVVTVGRDGKVNVMACSWNTPVSEEPPTVAISIWRESYTHQLLKEVPEFTINIPTAQLLRAVMVAGTASGREVDKVSAAGLTLRPARRVRPPVVEECVGHLECRVVEEIAVGECTLFVGEVLEAYASSSAFNRGWSLRDVDLLLHLWGRRFAIPKRTIWAKRE